MAKVKIEGIVASGLNPEKDLKKISRHIYGHFAEHLGRCIYDGFYVGKESQIPNVNGVRIDIVEALKKIKIPNLRWPGGCFADTYHWRDGIGPNTDRPKIVNIHWGDVVENNHFGTHEFMDLCDQLGCEPNICGNIGSGSVQEMYEWIEYLTFDKESTLTEMREINGRKGPWKVKYWGIGNENWGCGGNMRVEYYSDLIAQYSTYCKNYGENILYKIVSGPTGEMPMDFIKHWYEVLMDRATNTFHLGDVLFHAISLHYYTRAGASPAAKFREKKWFFTMKNALYMETLLTTVEEIMDKYDPKKKISLVVDEWGTWWGVEIGTNPSFLYQQNTMRDALVASLHLDIFNRHCDRVQMANIAQTINVLQAMILTDGEKMILTPTYHVFDMYKVHQEAYLIPICIESEPYKGRKGEIPSIHGSASLDKNGKVHISLCNVNPNDDIQVKIDFPIDNLDKKELSAEYLRGAEMNSHNTFENLSNVEPKEFDSGNFNVTSEETGKIDFKMPSMSIMVIEIR